MMQRGLTFGPGGHMIWQMAFGQSTWYTSAELLRTLEGDESGVRLLEGDESGNRRRI